MSSNYPMSSQELLKTARSFHTKKKLGQHLLINADALKQIAGSLELSPDDNVLEIGPGTGFLTRVLCAQAKQVTAVELDRESVEYLKSLKIENLSIKHGDFLSYDPASGRFREKGSKGWEEPVSAERIKVVGNVPYQITGLILARLLGEITEPSPHFPLLERIVLTVQKEVGERMVASPGNKSYAQLTLLVSYFTKAEIIMNLPASDFFPPPKVDSCVVKLTPLSEPPVKCKSGKFLRRVIKAGFAQRRKMLRNALLSLGISQEQINSTFNGLNFDPQVRAESLSLQQFAVLADALEPYAAGVYRKDSQ